MFWKFLKWGFARLWAGGALGRKINANAQPALPAYWLSYSPMPLTTSLSGSQPM